jgi:hypothetical protein
MKKVKTFYVSHRISDGGKLSQKECEKNCRRVINFVNLLRKKYPNYHFYIPAESEPFVHNAYIMRLLNYNQIIEIDCAIILNCDAVIFYDPDGFSKGMKLEKEFTLTYNIPYADIANVLEFEVADGLFWENDK